MMGGVVRWLGAALVIVPLGVARADRQAIAPGTGRQDAVVVDSGANGICDTAAVRDDLQPAAVGHGAAFEEEIRCGPDRIANTPAAGDDRQVLAVGVACQGPGGIVVDTGPDGIANSVAAGDDNQRIVLGTGAPNAPCIVAGANGVADTPDPVGGDDVRLLVLGTGEANSPVIRCGSNGVAETFANNVAAGDDVQRIGVGGGCPAANAVVVDSGANGIAETRAQGVELVLTLANQRPVQLAIRRRRPTTSKRVRLAVFNREFGSGAPGSRPYTLVVDDGSCPRGTVGQADADARAGGLQTTANVPLRGRVKGSFVVTLGLENVTSVDRKIPFRCAVQVEARALDTAPDPDDASNPANNAAQVTVEAVDQNDL